MHDGVYHEVENRVTVGGRKVAIKCLGGPLKVWRKTGSKTIYWHYHFSVYGKFEQKKAGQLKAIG
jgi:hypothetical protein